MKIICSLFLIFGCALNFTAQSEEIKPAPAIPEAKKNVDEGKAVVLDVREKDEFNKGHLTGARNVPLSQLKAGEIPADLPKDKPIYTHCMEGNRAKVAAKILNEKGYDAQPMVVDYDDLAKSFNTTK